MLQTISAAFHEGGWGMWLILITSIFIIGIIVERSVYLFKASVDKDKLLANGDRWEREIARNLELDAPYR